MLAISRSRRAVQPLITGQPGRRRSRDVGFAYPTDLDKVPHSVVLGREGGVSVVGIPGSKSTIFICFEIL